MWQLINVTQGIKNTHVIKFLYGILNKDLRWHVQSIVLNQLTQSTLVQVFQILERIKLNMIENKLVTLLFKCDTWKPH
jgi:hypothetical protein